jgi:transcriptional regulator with XRE-family HTH domain
MTKKQLERFAEKLRAARNRRRLTQEAMARALDVSTKTVARWERAEAEPDRASREKLDAFLGAPLEHVTAASAAAWK